MFLRQRDSMLWVAWVEEDDKNCGFHWVDSRICLEHAM